MNSREVIKIFEDVKSKYKIPEEAELEFVEKRYIELPDDAVGNVLVWDELVWIGEYTSEEYIYELAADMTGKIVRFKSNK